MSWQTDFADILTRDKELAPLTYYRIGGRARWFFEPGDAETTARLVAGLRAAGRTYRVLGGGANVLVEDGVDHEAPFLHLGRLNAFAVDGNRVIAGAGLGFPWLVRELNQRGLAGAEGLVGIPGQVGGACAMNAGGRHGEFADIVEWVEIATEDGDVRAIDRDGAGFGYRRSALPPGVVTGVSLRLESGEPEVLRAFSAKVLKEKAASQPLKMPSSGCIFTNPAADHAGRIVEELGLKGRRIGGAEISPQHGNFIVNHGDATSRDVLELIRVIEHEARERLGLELTREIRIWLADE